MVGNNDIRRLFRKDDKMNLFLWFLTLTIARMSFFYRHEEKVWKAIVPFYNKLTLGKIMGYKTKKLMIAQILTYVCLFFMFFTYFYILTRNAVIKDDMLIINDSVNSDNFRYFFWGFAACTGICTWQTFIEWRKACKAFISTKKSWLMTVFPITGYLF